MDLVKIENIEGIETVNARDLWTALESKQDFSTWAKSRLEGFEENQDYLVHKFMEQLPSGSKHKIDYYLTIDTAKHLTMLERNEIGKKIRQYFIDFEKKNKQQIPQTYAEALRLCADQVEQLEAQKKALQLAEPKIKFHDTVTKSENTLDMEQVSKLINMGFGRNKLIAELKNRGIFMASGRPYQRYVDAGYFKVVESHFTTTYGKPCIRLKTVAFQRGIEFIIRELSK